MQSKTSLCLLCQGKHIWDTCQSCYGATAETSAKLPTTTVVALVCMLLLLTKSVSFSCHEPELICLSFREISKLSNCIFMLLSKKIWLGGFSGPLFGFLFYFLEIYWQSPFLSRALVSNAQVSSKCSMFQWWRALLLFEGKLIWSRDPSVP